MEVVVCMVQSTFMVLLFLLGERRRRTSARNHLISRRPQRGTNELQILVLTIGL